MSAAGTSFTVEDAARRGTTRKSLFEVESAYAQLARKTKTRMDAGELTAQEHVGTTSTFATGTSLVTAIVGAGILSFPKVFSRGGWYASPICVVMCWWISLEIGWSMDRSIKLIYERIRGGKIFNFVRPVSFEDMADAAWGFKGKVFASFCINAFLLCLCGAFMILIGQCLEYLVNKAFWSPYRACVLATSVVFVPLQLMDDMSMIAKLTFVGMIASVVYGVAIGVGGLQGAAANDNLTYRYYPEKASDLGNVIAVMFLGFNFSPVVPTLRDEMKFPNELPKAMSGALFLVTIVYIIAGSSGYYGWGSTVEGNILVNMRTEEGRMWLGIALGVAVTANLLVTFPLFMNVVSRAAEAATVKRYSPVLRISLLLFAFTIAMFVPYFFQFLSLMGAVFGVMIGILPLGCFWVLARQDGLSKQPDIKFLAVRHVIVIIVALIAFVFGTATAINDLSDAMNKAAPGFWDYS